jgi:hypothetical protein
MKIPDTGEGASLIYISELYIFEYILLIRIAKQLAAPEGWTKELRIIHKEYVETYAPFTKIHVIFLNDTDLRGFM